MGMLILFLLQFQQIEVEVKSVLKDNLSPSYILVLEDSDEKRALPVFIGENEAFAIQREIEGIKTPRPMTHDLLARTIQEMNGKLEKVVITKIEKNTYYAELYIRQGGKLKRVDARPSDAVATALRLKAKIYIDEELLEKMGVPLEEGKEPKIPEKPKPKGEEI